MQYVELHARSAFTFLEGASLPEGLVKTCAEKEMSAMALLDRNGVYGAPRFHFAAKEHKIKAHVGSEISVTGMGNVPVLVQSQRGYQSLCRLITSTKLRTDKHKPSTTALSELENHASGLICLTGDENGPLAHALKTGGLTAARETVQELISIFGRENVYVELQRHFKRDQESRNQTGIALAREFHLPLLASNGVCYATPGEREIADAFTCIKNKCQLDTAGRLLSQNMQRYIRTPKQMTQLFADIPEAIANTVELSSRLEFTLENLGYMFPPYQVPDGETMDSFLRKRVWEGAQNRYRPVTDRVRTQLERELALIEKLHLAGYFLIVWDIVRYCEQNGILVQGRGSAANSATCYCLRITAIDPISMDLLFERFLSEERGEWPDIDLDTPSGDQREQAIQYVYQRYGRTGAAMTANVNTYRSRMAAKEMGKILGFDEDTLSRLSHIVGSFEWKDPKDTLERQFKQAGLDILHPRIAVYLDLCQRVKDLPRHLSQHSGGMVVCQGQLDAIVPIEPARMDQRTVVQWDKDDCADLGIIKIDLLGLGMMAALQESIALVRNHYGKELDLGHLAQDYPDVYDTLCKSDTVGLFQVESRAQMASLPRNKPKNFYDIVVQVALIRPGPITGHMTSPYLNRRQGKEPVTYAHPSLKPILEKTLGVPLFQEQLLKMAMVAANFTGGEAEELRRALGHKRSELRMREIEKKLRAGMTQNGIPPKAQDTIVQHIVSFAKYGFPESHAASFALIALASAILKEHYLGAFVAALLNNQPMGFYSSDTLIHDAKRHGLKVRHVDVTRSEWNYSLEHEDEGVVLRTGLRSVRGLRKQAAEALVKERSRAPFISIEDLARRVPELNEAGMRMLARIGAFNKIIPGLELHRRDALWQVEMACKPVGPLFEQIREVDTPSPLSKMSVKERLVSDYHGMGLTTGPHPISYRRKELHALGIKSSAELKRLAHGKSATVAGCVITRQRPGTANGLIFMTLEDEFGHANVIVTPDFYEKNRMAVLYERFVFVSGIVQNQDNVVHLKAQKIGPLSVSAAAIQSHDFH